MFALPEEDELGESDDPGKGRFDGIFSFSEEMSSVLQENTIVLDRERMSGILNFIYFRLKFIDLGGPNKEVMSDFMT